MTHHLQSYFFSLCGHNYDREVASCLQSYLRSYFFPLCGKKYDRKGASA